MTFKLFFYTLLIVGFKILLIEDDPFTLELYKEIFAFPKFELEVVSYCSDGVKILKEIREGRKKAPDLVLLDLILPDQSGINFLIEAKKYPETKNLKIFALTNYSDPKFNQELIEHGIDKILLKTDYTPKKLINLISETLEKNN